MEAHNDLESFKRIFLCNCKVKYFLVFSKMGQKILLCIVILEILLIFRHKVKCNFKQNCYLRPKKKKKPTLPAACSQTAIFTMYLFLTAKQQCTMPGFYLFIYFFFWYLFCSKSEKDSNIWFEHNDVFSIIISKLKIIL